MGVMSHGYIAVEFFFILSGYFIYKSCVKDNSKSVFSYTWSKIKRFYPEVLIVIIPSSLINYNLLLEHPEFLLNSCFFVSNTGVFEGGVNAPLWYLNVLIWGGGLVYAVLKNYRSVANTIIFPLSVLLIYTYLFQKNDGSLEIWGTYLCFYIPLWRGIAGMSLGCLLARFQEIKSKELQKRYSLINFLFLISIVGCLYIVFSEKHYDRYALLFYCIIILSCFTQNSLVNRLFKSTLWSRLGELSFEMLLVHIPITIVLMKLNTIFMLPDFPIIAIYLILVLVASMLLKMINNVFVNFLNKYELS